MLLERMVHRKDDAARLRGDIIFLDSDTVRVIFEFYARDRYAHNSTCGQQSVMAHHWTLPDNKIVEDMHQPLRLDSRANVNRRLSFGQIQDIITSTQVVKERGITHHCQVDKPSWLHHS